MPCVWLLMAGAGVLGRLPSTHAAVVVIGNRTAQQVAIEQLGIHQLPAIKIGPGQVVPIPTQGPVVVRLTAAAHAVVYRLVPNAAYFAAVSITDGVVLHEINLGQPVQSVAPATGQRPLPAIGEIPIRVFVDDREPTTRPVWELRLRKRVAAASAILESCCRTRLKIIGFSQWHIAAAEQDVVAALADFHRQAELDGAWLAIGFTSLYRTAPGRYHLGGAQGLLRTHILIRERSPKMTESQRLEVLVHELGHYLGAVHSPDTQSVMRPVLGDDQSVLKDYRITFDPANTLIMYLVGEELRRGVHSPAAISVPARTRLESIYQTIFKANPGDASARQMLFQLALAKASPRALATRQVLRAIVAAAAERNNDQQPAGRAHGVDQRTELLVRRAAQVAQTQPESVARSAFLLGLGIAVDATDMLRRNSLTRDFCRAIESDQQCAERHRVLGHVTVFGRQDLAQHFFLSAYLTTIVGRHAAEAAGLGKELVDAQGGSGFSYVDLAADLAGIEFAEQLLDNRIKLDFVATRFEVARHMPATDDLPEGLKWSNLWSGWTDDGTESLNTYRQRIQERINQLSAGHDDS